MTNILSSARRPSWPPALVYIFKAHMATGIRTRVCGFRKVNETCAIDSVGVLL